MKLNTTLNPQIKENTSASAGETTVRLTAQELPGLRHETKDVLKQLHANISCIEDLGGRLGFVLGEIRSLIRR